MLKTLPIVTLVAAAALAQNTLIPAGISPKCSDFLTNLNTDAELSTCTTALGGALSAFAPGASTASASQVTSALTSVCDGSIATSCPPTILASKITEFYSNCADELTTNPNKDVVRMYDALYVVPALQVAICSKNDEGEWCVTKAEPASGASAETIKAALYTQSGDNVVPNTDTFSQYNIPFLFLNPDSPNLCETCTRNVLSSFMNHESNIPYAPGLSNSLLLSTQSTLFSAVQSKCDPSFLEGEVKAAGGLSSSNILGDPSGAVPGAEFQGLVAALAGFATLAVSAIL